MSRSRHQPPEDDELYDLDPDTDDYAPPFDFARELPTDVDYQKSMRAVRKVDSTVERAFEGTHVDREVVEDLDRYFKSVWSKHHG